VKKIKKTNKEDINLLLLVQKEERIRYLEGQVNSLKNKIDNMERSVTWHFIKRIDKLIDFLFPQGSKLRKLYYSFIEFNQKIINKPKKDFSFVDTGSLEENIFKKIELLRPFKKYQIKIFGKNHKQPLYKTYFKNKFFL
jgi:hypothetical protein